MTTITLEQQQAIATKLANMHLPRGIGNEETACSIAAINLALSGQLTDDIPQCMSEVVGKWVLWTQDAMPDKMRNSPEWKRLLPFAAGTGRGREEERLAIILDWMWGSVLSTFQPLSDENGFGDKWAKMLSERTPKAAKAASSAACTSPGTSPGTDHGRCLAASFAADKAAAAARFRHSRGAAARAVAAARTVCYAADRNASFWSILDPCGLLERLIDV